MGPSITWTTSLSGTIPMRSASGAASARMFTPELSSVAAITYDPASNQSATLPGASMTAVSATTCGSDHGSAGARYVPDTHVDRVQRELAEHVPAFGGA